MCNKNIDIYKSYIIIIVLTKAKAFNYDVILQ